MVVLIVIDCDRGNLDIVVVRIFVWSSVCFCDVVCLSVLIMIVWRCNG